MRNNSVCVKFILCLIVILFIPALLCTEGYSQQPDSDIIRLKTGILTFLPTDSLPYLVFQNKNIIYDSLTVTCGAIILHDRADYTVNKNTNVVLFDRKWYNHSCQIRYLFIPVALEHVFFRRIDTPEIPENENVSVSDSLRVPGRWNTEEDMFKDVDLTRSGSLVRGITIGSGRDLSLNSGFRMDINGNLGKDLRLTASLTDQTSPLQPEGTTQNIKEIDKIFIQLAHPRFTATLGDFYFKNDNSGFAGFERKMEGGMIEISAGTNKVTGFISSKEGEFYSNKFTGVEGNQGPYQLYGKNNEKDITVLGGTEKVWIDGVQMLRGETNDYVIDYSLGQVMFTKNRLITGDSRIEIDFEYSNRIFKRTLYGVKHRGSLANNALTYGFSFINERDAKDNPLDFEYSDDELSMLRSIGDSVGTAVHSGVVYVGAGKGNYIKKDSLGTEIYTFTGEGLGEYIVRFTYVGEPAGDYALKSIGEYVWTGTGTGSYLPVVKVPVPESRSIGAANVGYTYKDNLSLNMEYAISSADKNMFSEKDDSDNSSGAYSMDLTAKTNRTRMGIFSVKGNYLYRNSGFSEAGRTREVEFERKWFLFGNPAGNERTYEVEAALQSDKNMLIKAFAGEFSRGGDFSSDRSGFSARIDNTRMKNWNYRLETIQSSAVGMENNWFRQAGSGSVRLWKLQPGFRFEYEDKKPDPGNLYTQGIKFHDAAGTLDFNLSKKLNLSAGYANRADWEYQDGEKIYISNAYTRSAGAAYQPSRQFSARFDLVNRDRVYADRGKVTTNLAGSKIKYTTKNRALDAQWDYQLATERTPKTERVYIRVEDGKGNYSYEPGIGDYIPDFYGDYILRILPTDEYIPTNEIQSGIRLRFAGKRLFKERHVFSGAESVLRCLELKTLLKAEDKTVGKSRQAFYFVNWGNLLTGATFTGRMQFRQDISYTSGSSDFVVRGWYNSLRVINNQYIDRNEENRFQDLVVKGEVKLARRWRGSVDLSKKNIRKDIHPNTALSRNIVSYQAAGTLIKRTGHNFELLVSSSAGKDTDNSSDNRITVKYYSLQPGFLQAFSGRGRLQGRLVYNTVKSDPAGIVIPYEMANGFRNGTTVRWQLNLNYNLSRSIMAYVQYSGEKRERDAGVFQTAKMEIRALF